MASGGSGDGGMSHLLFRCRIWSFKETVTQYPEMILVGSTESLPPVVISEQGLRAESEGSPLCLAFLQQKGEPFPCQDLSQVGLDPNFQS